MEQKEKGDTHVHICMSVFTPRQINKSTAITCPINTPGRKYIHAYTYTWVNQNMAMQVRVWYIHIKRIARTCTPAKK